MNQVVLADTIEEVVVSSLPALTTRPRKLLFVGTIVLG